MKSIPLFYRILIIDDRVYNHDRYKEFFRNSLSSFVWEAAGDKIIHTEVVFLKDSVDGLKRWQEEVFDLTLIDSDFTENQPEDRENDLVKFVLNSERQGFNILQMLLSLTSEDGKYSYRKDMSNFFLWSGLDLKTIKDLFKTYLMDKRKYFIAKSLDWSREKDKKNSLEIIKEEIEKGVNRTLLEYFKRDQLIERFLFALRKNYDLLQQRFNGGCLIISEKGSDHYPFLEEFGTTGKSDNEVIRVCPSSIPPRILENTESVFLPLHGNIYNGDLANAVRYLKNQPKGKNGEPKIAKYCLQLKNRAIQEDKKIPIYSKKKYGDKERLEYQFQEAGKNQVQILDYPYKNRYIAAATPLTGISVIGEMRAIDALCDKIVALLNGPFGAVVLKTTYLDAPSQWEGVYWPGVQIQSHMRTRCLFPATGTATFWNTGRTPLEMLPPSSLNCLLHSLSNNLQSETYRVIVSIGSKYQKPGELIRGYRDNLASAMQTIWETLFSTIFQDLQKDAFPIVEINVRHYLREIVKYYLGGDEYLNPVDFNEKNLPNPDFFWEEFKIWLRVLHDVAVDHNKRIILKLPHRSDTIAFVKCAASLRELHRCSSNVNKKDFGVRGITLINALKTPVPASKVVKQIVPYTAAWYANPKSWEDGNSKLLKYQMSGGFVVPYRNQILAGIIPVVKKMKELKLEILLSGGITTKSELDFCNNIEKELAVNSENDSQGNIAVTGIQIGTWGLLGTDLSKKDWGDISDPKGPTELGSVLDTTTCKGTCCGDEIVQSCLKKLLRKNGKGFQVELSSEKECLKCETRDCINACKFDNLGMKVWKDEPNNQLARTATPEKEPSDETDAILPRICFLNQGKCEACGNCLQTFYCDSFLDRVNTALPPKMDVRNCSGCGLCVQVCSTGALQLYSPDERLVLISDSTERKEILNLLKIPLISYSPQDDIENFTDLTDDFINDLKLLTADNKSCNTEVFKKELQKAVEEIWLNRVGKDPYGKNKYILGRGKEKLYPDNRSDLEIICQQVAKDLIGKISDPQHSNKPEHCTAIARAVVWSQLIWSDPGQVLWDSFLLTLQSYLEGKSEDNDKDTGWERIENPTVDSLTSNREYRITSFVVLLRQGEIILAEEPFYSEPFTIQKTLDQTKLKYYHNSEFGSSRLAGLDVRTSGHFLIKDFKPFMLSNTYAIAGLPWDQIRRKIENPDFEKLLDAVEKRG